MAAPNLAKINSDIGKADSTITWVAIVYTLLFAVGCETPPYLEDKARSIFSNQVLDRFRCPCWPYQRHLRTSMVFHHWRAPRRHRQHHMLKSTESSYLDRRHDSDRCMYEPRSWFECTLTFGPASASQQGLYSSVIGELVPIKYRFIASTGFYILGSPFGIFATKVGIDITDTLGWRWIFYINIILNALSTICWYLFYHPPTFEMLHHGRETIRQVLKHFDYIGFVLFNGGFVLLILGLSWGGSLYGT